MLPIDSDAFVSVILKHAATIKFEIRVTYSSKNDIFFLPLSIWDTSTSHFQIRDLYTYMVLWANKSSLLHNALYMMIEKKNHQTILL